MKSWLVNLAPVVQTLDSAIVTTAAQVLRACNVTTCFLNLTLCYCKFAILEVYSWNSKQSVSFLTCISAFSLRTFQH